MFSTSVYSHHDRGGNCLLARKCLQVPSRGQRRASYGRLKQVAATRQRPVGRKKCSILFPFRSWGPVRSGAASEHLWNMNGAVLGHNGTPGRGPGPIKVRGPDGRLQALAALRLVCDLGVHASSLAGCSLGKCPHDIMILVTQQDTMHGKVAVT